MTDPSSSAAEDLVTCPPALDLSTATGSRDFVELLVKETPRPPEIPVQNKKTISHPTAPHRSDNNNDRRRRSAAWKERSNPKQATTTTTLSPTRRKPKHHPTTSFAPIRIPPAERQQLHSSSSHKRGPSSTSSSSSFLHSSSKHYNRVGNSRVGASSSSSALSTGTMSNGSHRYHHHRQRHLTSDHNNNDDEYHSLDSVSLASVSLSSVAGTVWTAASGSVWTAATVIVRRPAWGHYIVAALVFVGWTLHYRQYGPQMPTPTTTNNVVQANPSIRASSLRKAGPTTVVSLTEPSDTMLWKNSVLNSIPFATITTATSQAALLDSNAETKQEESSLVVRPPTNSTANSTLDV